MIPTQDPDYTATRLLRLADKAKKPVRVFLSVNNKGGKWRQLIATDDASMLVKGAPREELTIHPGASHPILAAAIEAIFTRLQPQIPSHYPKPQQQRFNPGVRA